MPGAPLHFGRAIGRWKVFQAPDAPILVAYGTLALAEAQERAAAAAHAGQTPLVIAIVPVHAPQGWQVGVGARPETFRWVSTHHLLKDAEAQARQIIAGTRQAQRQRRQP
jgi:hypothetical protein